jgi:hypothetical protein
MRPHEVLQELKHHEQESEQAKQKCGTLESKVAKQYAAYLASRKSKFQLQQQKKRKWRKCYKK